LSTNDKWVPVTMTWRVLMLQIEEWPPMWRVATNIWNKQSQTADKRGSSSFGVWRGAKSSLPYKCTIMNRTHRKPMIWTDNLVQPKQWKRYMGFGLEC